MKIRPRAGLGNIYKMLYRYMSIFHPNDIYHYISLYDINIFDTIEIVSVGDSCHQSHYHKKNNTSLYKKHKIIK